MWEKESGKAYTNIQPAADVNDVAVYPETGMIFAALETERLGAYFVPSLGPAPRWCHFLDNMTEEMEQVQQHTTNSGLACRTPYAGRLLWCCCRSRWPAPRSTTTTSS